MDGRRKEKAESEKLKVEMNGAEGKEILDSGF